MEGDLEEGNVDEEDKENEIMEEEDKEKHDMEEEDKGNFIRWISLLLLHLKLQYNLSNTMFSILLNLIYFIFWVIRHPLHIFFPKTINDLEIIANLKVLNKTVIFAVCPNTKCSALYDMKDISYEKNGIKRAAVCRKKLMGKRCNTELSFERKLSFGRRKWYLTRHIPFLHLQSG